MGPLEDGNGRFQPDKVRAVFGDGRSLGKQIHYAVEETPLGTGGAVKNAVRHLDDTTVVFNGDVLTDVDLAVVVREHQQSGARATLVLTPVPNPSAYGLVETDASGRVLRFVEKPDPSQITTDTINAGIYVLQTSTLELMPEAVNHSIERAFFPALLGRGDLVRAHVHRGYWIDIGTPEKYLQVHRDILRGRFPVDLAGKPAEGGWIHPEAVVEAGVRFEGPFYLGPGCHVAAGAQVGPDAVLTERVTVHGGARVKDSVVWRETTLGPDCLIEGALLGPGVLVGRNAVVGPGAMLGGGTSLTDFSRTR